MSGPKYGKPGVKSDRNFLRVLIDGKSKILSKDINDSNKALYNIEENILGQAPTFWSKSEWSENVVPERKAPYVTKTDGASLFPTVADRIDYIQNQVEHIYSRSSSGNTRFTFAPAKKQDKAKRVYSDWNSLYNDLKNADGTKTIFFDDEGVTGRVTIPISSNGKPYDMKDIQWSGDPSRTDPCEDTLSDRENLKSKLSTAQGFYQGDDSGSYSTKKVSGKLYAEISSDEYEFIKILVAKNDTPPSDGYLSVGDGTEVVKYSGAFVRNAGLTKAESEANNLYFFPIEQRGVKGASTLVHSTGGTAEVVSVIKKEPSGRTQVELAKGARFNRIPQSFKYMDVLFNASEASKPAFLVDRSEMLNPDSHYYRQDFAKTTSNSASFLTPCDEIYMKSATFSIQGSSVPPISIGENSRVRFVMEGSSFNRTSAISSEIISINGSSSELEVFGDKDSSVANNIIRGAGVAVFDVPDFDKSQPNLSGSNNIVKGGIAPSEISVDQKHLRTKNGIVVDGQVLSYNRNTGKVGFAINGLNQILKQDSTSYFPVKVGGITVEPETYKSSVSDYVGSFAITLQGPSSTGLTARGYASSIVGGAYNTIDSDASYSIAGGYKNQVGGANSTAFGSSNEILGDNSASFGYLNKSDATSDAVTMFGVSNVVDSSDFSSIIGGESKISSSSYSSINSGFKNEMKSGSDYSVIAGGRGNVMQSTSSAIVGGRENTISVSASDPASFASMIFGYKNKIVNADHSVILSGSNNIIDSEGAASDGYGSKPIEYGSILSGSRNKVKASNAVVLGGMGALAEKEGDIVMGWSDSGEASANNNTIVMNAKTGDITIKGALNSKDNIKLLTHGSDLFSLYGEVSPAIYNVQSTDKIIAVDTTAIQKKRKDWGETTGSRWYSGPITVRLPDVQVIDDSGQGGRMIMFRHVCGTSPIYVYPSKNDEKLGAAIDWNDYLVIEPGTAKGVFETRYGWFIW